MYFKKTNAITIINYFRYFTILNFEYLYFVYNIIFIVYTMYNRHIIKYRVQNRKIQYCKRVIYFMCVQLLYSLIFDFKYYTIVKSYYELYNKFRIITFHELETQYFNEIILSFFLNFN